MTAFLARFSRLISAISGACRRHQVQVAQAVKRAREMALLPYVAEGVEGSERESRGRGRSREDR